KAFGLPSLPTWINGNASGTNNATRRTRGEAGNGGAREGDLVAPVQARGAAIRSRRLPIRPHAAARRARGRGRGAGNVSALLAARRRRPQAARVAVQGRTQC